MKGLRVALSVILALVGAASLSIGTVLRWTDGRVFDTPTVSATATEVLRDSDVQALLTQEITAKVMQFVVDEAQRGTVTNLVTGIVSDQRTLALLDEGVRQAHSQLVDGDSPTIQFNLRAVAVEVRAQLVKVAPELDAQLPPPEAWFDFKLLDRTDLPQPYDWIERFHGSAVPLMVFGVCLIGLALVLGPARWALLMTSGLGVAIFGLGIAYALRQATSAAKNRIDDPIALAASKDVFRILFGDLNRQAITLMVGGAIAALLGISIGLIRPEYLREKDPWAPQERRRTHR